ncbi:MAG: hypothetical protein HY000_01690, partial [Planctomycetes bacterium]|nr:hypothetical protein [Planctomycetota bacterium]
MPTPQEISDAIHRVRDHATLIEHLLSRTLQWPIEDRIQKIDDIAFGWTAEELRAESLGDYLVDGQAWQIRPMRDPQPWGIFVLEFHDDRVYRTALRQVLRGLVPKRRRDANLPTWRHDNLLFICTTRDYEQITFAHFRGEKAQTARLATFGWQRDDRHVRTVCEFSLPALEWPDDDADAAEWIEQWSAAFDKERLTKDFFRRFDDAVAAVQADLERHQGLKSSAAYSAAQLLLERLIFLYFLQNRGWLNQERDYLFQKLEPHRGRPKDFTYYREFLESLFWSLASPPRGPGRLPGIPFLNGGLFDDDEFTPLSASRMKHKPPLKV